MSYVYRYAGMLEEATNECNTALALDPGNYIFRSCAWAFMELGKTDRAADFIRLDAGSEWAAYVEPSLLLREGKVAEAREAVKHMPTAPRYHRDLLESCLQLRPASDLDRLAQEAETSFPADPDPGDLVLRRRALCVLRKESRRPASSAERDRQQLLLVLQSADRPAAGQAPLRPRHRQAAYECASMPGSGEDPAGSVKACKPCRS